MSSFDPIHYSGMLIGPRTNHEAQQLLIETGRIQSSRQPDDLGSIPYRLGKLEFTMESSGLEGAGLLCSSLSELSEALVRKPCAIDSSQGFEALGEGASRLAEYVSLVSARIPVSPLVLSDTLIRIQQLLGNNATTPLDLFKPYAHPTGFANTLLYIDPIKKFRVIDQTFHVMFREHLSIYLKEQESKSLEAVAELFDRIKFDNEDPLSQLAYLVSSCIELVQYQSDKFGVHEAIGILFAEVDFLIRQICRSNVTDGRIELPETLFPKMLFLIGDAVYGKHRDDHILPQHIGPDTEKICELFRLEEWFTGSPDQVMQAECRKCVQLAGELSKLARKGNYHSLKNSLALFFLDGLDSKRTVEMLERLDELKEAVSVHADSVLKTCVVCLCETIASVDINAEDFPDSREDTKIASAWMMLWDFVEDPHALTIEKIHCLGQRIAGSIEMDCSLDSDINFMQPWPNREFTESSNVLIAEITKSLSTATDILREIDKKGVGGTRLGEVQSVVRQIEDLFAIAGDASAMEMTRHAGSLIDQAINSGDHVGTFVEELALITDSIREGAVMMVNDANPVRDLDSRFDRVRDMIEEYLARQETPRASQADPDYGPIIEQLQAVGSALKRWQEDLADREIVVGIREGFSRLAELCETCRHREISRICNAVVPMMSEKNLKTASDSTVILNLLLEVHQSIETVLKEDSHHAQGHLSSILRMVEKL